MVRRYSVERDIVTHWNVGNEVDIGENGGTPFLTPTVEAYTDFYRMTMPAIVQAAPHAKVGGPAVANAAGPLLGEFIEVCRREKLRLDFIAWHLYADDPALHRSFVDKHRKLLEGFGEHRPDMMVTEWNKGFDEVSVEELAFEPRRAANAAAILLQYIDAGLDWSFYYHVLDQVCYRQDFAGYFAKPEIMYHHWNEVPHRFGLFGAGEEVRPQYFVYWMLQRMGERRVAAQAGGDLRVLASGDSAGCRVLLVNFGMQGSRDQIATIRVSGLQPGTRMLTVYRVDQRKAWDAERLEMRPSERREVEVEPAFEFQIFCPADSVMLAELG
jgi:hypothetical protein